MAKPSDIPAWVPIVLLVVVYTAVSVVWITGQFKDVRNEIYSVRESVARIDTKLDMLIRELEKQSPAIKRKVALIDLESKVASAVPKSSPVRTAAGFVQTFDPATKVFAMQDIRNEATTVSFKATAETTAKLYYGPSKEITIPWKDIQPGDSVVITWEPTFSGQKVAKSIVKFAEALAAPDAKTKPDPLP